ncbi:MAG TPA: transporter [Verrucomicrobiae bacterium]|jgi:hypothetical protein
MFNSSNRLYPVAVALGLGLATASGRADESGLAAADKSAFNLFNPTPAALMRELSPDRPDKTESAYTLDAGHFMLEMDFANYTYNQTAGTTTRAWNVAPFNLKVGLLNNVDWQLVFDDYLDVRTKMPSGQTITESGVGDLTTRLKINLWGDDGGRTALALLPYLKAPTSSGDLGNDAFEGGVILPLAVKLPGDFDLGLETAFSCLRNLGDDHYHADFINSATLDHVIVGDLSGYVEFFSEVGTEPAASWVGTVDAGLEFLVTKNIQLDCGCNFGVTRAADKFNPFAGITWRF